MPDIDGCSHRFLGNPDFQFCEIRPAGNGEAGFSDPGVHRLPGQPRPAGGNVPADDDCGGAAINCWRKGCAEAVQGLRDGQVMGRFYCSCWFN
jgi:hypothetical protein